MGYAYNLSSMGELQVQAQAERTRKLVRPGPKMKKKEKKNARVVQCSGPGFKCSMGVKCLVK